ncbi:hypothetical protein [Streptomyces zingiberis]|uniref:Integral membrane protein n=1 Tax=Streptomyces zingiberis TaxID=2053010 RepID=A0ABX1BSQ4_9ACTN|nr:hypothetical protein [Streptomyces zingiberis]NJQ00741.1 hypothetical protein [Streptomyces zingiberis]
MSEQPWQQHRPQQPQQYPQPAAPQSGQPTAAQAGQPYGGQPQGPVPAPQAGFGPAPGSAPAPGPHAGPYPGPDGAPGGFPAPPPPAPSGGRSGNAGLALGAAVVLMVVGALVYGLILKEAEVQIGYLAVGVGALIGLALGKLGGRNPVLPFAGAVLGLLGVYLGQVFGIAMAFADLPSAPGFLTVLTDHFGDINRGLKENLEVVDYLFYALSGAAAFSLTRKTAG